MNVGIGNEAAQFHFWEYLFQIFSTVSLQCTQETRICESEVPKQDEVLQHKGQGKREVQERDKNMISASSSCTEDIERETVPARDNRQGRERSPQETKADRLERFARKYGSIATSQKIVNTRSIRKKVQRDRSVMTRGREKFFEREG
jgi:hypothetical protein